MARSTPPAAPAAPPTWADAVRTVLDGRDATCEQPIAGDADQLQAALEALIATGRCRASDGHGRSLAVRHLRAANQQPMAPGPLPRTYAKRTAPDDPAKDPQWRAFALEGDAGAFVINIAALTYLPARRGAPAERVVFHIRLGEVRPGAFLNDPALAAPSLFFGRGGHLLLADAELDIGWLLYPKVDPDDLDALGEAVRGRPREGYVDPAVRQAKEEAIAAVRAAYQDHRGPQPRAVTQEDIDVIVRTALAHGLLVNLELVHAATDNRGSPNSVYPKLADAMHRLAPRRPADDEADPVLREVWSTLKSAAKSLAEESLAPERAALATEREALAEAQAALAAERERDSRAAAERQQLLERLDTELAAARTRIESLTDVERGQAQELASLRAERDGLQARLAEARQRSDASEAELVEVSSARDRTQTELERQQRASAAAAEQAAAQLEQRTAELASARQTAEALQRQLRTAEQAHGDLRAALATAERAVADADARSVQLTERLAAAEASAAERRREHQQAVTQLRTQLEASEARASTLQAELLTASANHQAVMRERDRLDQLLARLAPSDVRKPR